MPTSKQKLSMLLFNITGDRIIIIIIIINCTTKSQPSHMIFILFFTATVLFAFYG